MIVGVAKADFTPWCQDGNPSHHVPSTHVDKTACEDNSACVWAWQRQVGASKRQCVMKKDCSAGCTYSGAGCYVNTDLRLDGTALDCSYGGLAGVLDITNTPPEVEYIYLDHNAITSVTKGTLDPMRDAKNPDGAADPVLRWLSLDHNNLEEIPDGLFDGLTKVTLPVHPGAFDDGGHLIVTLEGNTGIAEAPKAVVDGPPSVINLPQDTVIAASESACSGEAGTVWSYTGDGDTKRCYIKRVTPAAGGTYQGLGCQKRGSTLHCEKRGIQGDVYIDNMPSDITFVDFRWNRITGVHHDTWLPVQGTLKRLWFDYNDLVLHDEIFSDLEAVIDIRLQHNPIATTHAILRGPPFIIPLPQDAPVAADKTTCDAQGGTIWSYTKGKCLYHTVSDGTCQVNYAADDDALDPMVDQLTILPTGHSGGRQFPTHDAKDRACMLRRTCGASCKYQELGCVSKLLIENGMSLLDCSGRGIYGAVNINNVPSDTFKIDMSFNAIEEVTNDMLVMSSNLRYIDLSYNYLKYFRAGQFDNLIHVKGVRLIARTQGVDANNIPFRSPITVVEAPIIDGPQHLIQLPQDSPVAAEAACGSDYTAGTHWGYNGLGNTEAERKASKQCWLTRRCSTSGCDYQGLGCQLESRGTVLNCAAKGISGPVYIQNTPTTVVTFRFSYNAISSINPLTWDGNADKVENIDLDYNFLTSVGAASGSSVSFTELPKLRSILLNDNSITELLDDGFNDLPMLRSLYLTNNPIDTVEAAAAKKLRSGITLPKATLNEAACNAQPGTVWSCPYHCFHGHYNDVVSGTLSNRHCLPCPAGTMCSGDMHNSPFPWSTVMHKQTACCLAEAHTTGESRCCSLIIAP